MSPEPPRLARPFRPCFTPPVMCYWLLVMHYWPSVKNSTENPEMVPVIGHLCHLHINYVHFNGFILNVSLLFGKLKENTTDFSAQKFLKTSNLEI